MALISDKIIKLLNYRIQQEEQSSRLYKSISIWLNLNGFTGASKLWDKYSKEEQSHAQWSYDYLLDLNIKPITPSQEEPQNEFKGLANIIALSYKHELDITEQVKLLAKTCLDEGDLMTFNLAQKYVWEQVEEISKLQYFLDYLQSFGDTGTSLAMLDEKMGETV